MGTGVGVCLRVACRCPLGWDSAGLAGTMHNQDLFLKIEPVVEDVWPQYLLRHRLLLTLRCENEPKAFWLRLTKKSMMENHVPEAEIEGLQTQLVTEKVRAMIFPTVRGLGTLGGVPDSFGESTAGP